jgi:hypothetical protein
VEVVDLVEDEAREAAVVRVLHALTIEGGELDADGDGMRDGDADVESSCLPC